MQTIKINASDFKTAIKNTIDFVSTDETREAMTGILFDRNNEYLRLVSTNGRHLVSYQIKAVFYDDFESFILKIPQNKESLFDEKFIDDIEIKVDEYNVIICKNDYELSFSKILKEFPDYRKIIPSSFSKFIKINRNDFIESIVQTIPKKETLKDISFELKSFNSKELVVKKMFSRSLEEICSIKIDENDLCKIDKDLIHSEIIKKLTLFPKLNFTFEKNELKFVISEKYNGTVNANSNIEYADFIFSYKNFLSMLFLTNSDFLSMYFNDENSVFSLKCDDENLLILIMPMKKD